MKTLFVDFKIISLVILSFCLSFSAAGAHYYVVIATFSDESYARSFAFSTRDVFPESAFLFQHERRLYHVYAFGTKVPAESEARLEYVRVEKGFPDAWIYTAFESEENGVTTGLMADREPRYSSGQNFIVNSREYIASVKASPKRVSQKRSDLSDDSLWSHGAGISYMSGIERVDDSDKNIRAHTDRVFSFAVEWKGQPIPADVVLISNRSGQKITTFSAEELTALRASGTGDTFSFICDVPGYTMQSIAFNPDYLRPNKSMKQNAQGVWEVRFNLTRLHTDNVHLLFPSMFYPDASILRPETLNQMDALLSLLQSDVWYEVVINSHCDPGSKRPLKLRHPAGGYFDIAEAVERTGTDKLLTRVRAETVRSYFDAHGIPANLIKVMGWGGMVPLAKGNGKDISTSDRIEVELIIR